MRPAPERGRSPGGLSREIVHKMGCSHAERSAADQAQHAADLVCCDYVLNGSMERSHLAGKGERSGPAQPRIRMVASPSPTRPAQGP